MCPPPCGPRRNSRPAYYINTRISKRAVAEVIASGDYECFTRNSNQTETQSYDGCADNLRNILYDPTTKVKVAGPKSDDFDESYRTIIMNAPCFPAVFILRTKE